MVIKGKITMVVTMGLAMAAAMEAQGALSGKALLEARCSSCHEVKTVVAMKKTRRQWQKVIVDMKSAGAKVSDAEAAAIVNYLSKPGK